MCAPFKASLGASAPLAPSLVRPGRLVLNLGRANQVKTVYLRVVKRSCVM